MLDPKDLIKEKLDIVEVIREFLPLKAAGSNWKALCPFHNEKTPSFMVSPDRQSWRCFGCGKGGDVFSFVMEKEGMEFPEVLRMFSERTGIELKRGDVKLQNQKTQLYDIMDAAVEWWHSRLASDEGASARAYLTKRGISDALMVDWQLGFAPESWDRLSQHLMQKGFTLADIIASGVVIERPKKDSDRRLPFYDRFRGRIIFPIRDGNGATIGAGGRVLPGASDEQSAKYINNPETLLYNKSRILFALDRAKRAIKEEDRAVLVEGYMDALSSHAVGVTNVVAVSGTALTSEHAKLLHRYTDTVALCFDEDIAGQAASRRGVDVLLQEGLTVHVVTLPKGLKDPDECIQKDPALWRRAVAESTPIFDALLARAARRNLTDVREKKAIAKDLLALIAKIPDGVERSHYVRQLASLLAVPETFLYEALSQERRKREGGGDAALQHVPQRDRHGVLSERFLSLIVTHQEHLGMAVAHVPSEALAPGPLRDLYTDIVTLYNQNQSPEGIATVLGAHQELVDRLTLASEHFFSSFDRPTLIKEIRTSSIALRQYVLREELARIEQEMRQSADDAAAGTKLLTRAQEITQMLAELG